MAIDIGDGARIHEAQILHRAGFVAAGGEAFGGDGADGLAEAWRGVR